jgi:hypothetical protein
MNPPAGTAWVFVAVVAITGCDRAAMTPDGFHPASRFGCPDLVGDYRIEDARDIDAWMPRDDAKDVPDWQSLSIEPDPIHGGLRKVLRRDPTEVTREAAALREQSPDDYARWREQVRYALRLEPGKAGHAYGEGLLRKHGPPVEVASGFATSDDCESGWAPSPHADSSRRYSRGVRGELLMQVGTSREVETGWSFFGSRVTYPRRDRTLWYRLTPLLPGSAVRFDATALMTPAPASARRPRRVDIDAATRALAAEASALLRAAMPHGVSITLLRQTQFDEEALSLAPHAVRMEVAGTFAGDLDPDPFQHWLRRAPRAEAIELRKRQPRGRDRTYALVRFTWHTSERRAP